MLFHHVGVHVSDFAKSRKIYDALFDVLGYPNYDVPGHIATAWGTTDCSFRIVQPPTDKISASSSHVCFGAPTEEAVAAFFAAGAAAGAEGLFPPNEYVDWGHRHVTAMVRDFDGNCVEAVYVDPEIVE